MATLSTPNMHYFNMFIKQIGNCFYWHHADLRNIPDPADADSECAPKGDGKGGDAAIKLSYAGLLYLLSKPPVWVASSSRASIDESRLYVPSLETQANSSFSALIELLTAILYHDNLLNDSFSIFSNTLKLRKIELLQTFFHYQVAFLHH